MKKKICVITGSRADYGILYPLLKKIASKRSFALQIVATGMHLSSKFGSTFKEIEKDGFKITKKVSITLSGDSEVDISKAIGEACIGFADAFKTLKPDLVVVLGDRFEIFAAVIPAFIAKIPVAHLHGGELTEGTMDEAFRHSITKMSFLHFTSTEKYRQRVIQLGESPNRVFNVGALGVDNIVSLKYKSAEALEKELKISLRGKTALVTFHPATLEEEIPLVQFNELLKALDAASGLNIIFTLPNADTNGRAIIKAIHQYVKKNPLKARAFASLGRLNYLSLLRQVQVVVGNSSSAIIEAPSLGKPAVNIGLRQKGRIMASSVINCPARHKEIANALQKALSSRFMGSARKVKNPYGDGKTAERIVKILNQKIPQIKSIKKEFKDI